MAKKRKTKKAFKKRFRVTRRGKVLGSRSMRRHMMGDRSAKRKRQSRRGIEVGIALDAKKIKAGLPYS